MSRYPLLSPAEIARSAEIEEYREAQCQRLPCQRHGTKPGWPCNAMGPSGWSCIGRYRLAAEAGLVPRLVGDRG